MNDETGGTQKGEKENADALNENNKDVAPPTRQKNYVHMPEVQILVQDWPPHPDPRIYAANIFKSAKGDLKDNKLVSAAVSAEF
jgi:hypothetical protein